MTLPRIATPCPGLSCQNQPDTPTDGGAGLCPFPSTRSTPLPRFQNPRLSGYFLIPRTRGRAMGQDSRCLYWDVDCTLAPCLLLPSYLCCDTPQWAQWQFCPVLLSWGPWPAAEQLWGGAINWRINVRLLNVAKNLALSKKVNTSCCKTLKTEARFLRTAHEFECLPPAPGTGEMKILLCHWEFGITGGNVVTCACQQPASNFIASNGFPLPWMSFRTSPKKHYFCSSATTIRYGDSTLHEPGPYTCMCENHPCRGKIGKKVYKSGHQSPVSF